MFFGSPGSTSSLWIVFDDGLDDVHCNTVIIRVHGVLVELPTHQQVRGMLCLLLASADSETSSVLDLVEETHTQSYE